ncbi:hypothetical protein SNEBB_007513 [Seison nebaliae]|nr:hypothetical protein SNEBB_007513 [Seison nebaliae]
MPLNKSELAKYIRFQKDTFDIFGHTKKKKFVRNEETVPVPSPRPPTLSEAPQIISSKRNVFIEDTKILMKSFNQFKSNEWKPSEKPENGIAVPLKEVQEEKDKLVNEDDLCDDRLKMKDLGRLMESIRIDNQFARFPNSISEIGNILQINEIALPSVTEILKMTTPKKNEEILKKWKEKKIRELGSMDEFERMSKHTLSNGKELHYMITRFFAHRRLMGKSEKNVKKLFNDCLLQLNINNRLAWNSLRSLLLSGSYNDRRDADYLVSPYTIGESTFSEIQIQHPFLGYRCVIDHLSRVNDKLSIIDWKRSDRLKYSYGDAYDYPLQLAAYGGALKHSLLCYENEENRNQSRFYDSLSIDMLKGSDDSITFKSVNNCYLIYAYNLENEATVLHMNPQLLTYYWQLFLRRYLQYFRNKLIFN